MGRKKRAGDFRPIGFKAPVEHYEVLAEVAAARGVDLSAVLNQVVAESLPGLRVWLQQQRDPPRPRPIETGAGDYDRVYHAAEVPDELARRVSALVSRAWDAAPGDREAVLWQAAAPPDGPEVVRHARELLRVRDMYARLAALRAKKGGGSDGEK